MDHRHRDKVVGGVFVRFRAPWDEFVAYDWQRIYDSIKACFCFLMEEIY
jgi:hypothetical protein